MSSKISKKKGFGELPLYRSLSLFLNELTPIILNINKDIKITMGYELIKDTVKTLKILHKSYLKNDFKDKLVFINETIELVSEIELTLKLIFELGFITENQSANLSIKIADVILQLNSWKTNIEKRFEDKN